jgi:hypothetical protein
VNTALRCASLADLDDLIFILLVSIVIVLLGFFARDAVSLNKRGRRIGQGLSITELLIGTGGCGVGAGLVHEGSDKDGLAVGAAVGSNKKFHLLILLLAVVILLAIVVLLLVCVDALIVVIILKGILVNVEFPTFDGLLKVKLHAIVVVVIVIIILVIIFLTVIKTCTDVASEGVIARVPR